MKNLKILLIDDEESQREPLKGFLVKRNYEVYDADSCDNAMKLFKTNTIDLIISDFKMPGKTGKDVIYEAREINPYIPIIITTAFGEIEDAVNLMKLGAFDYLQKPIELSTLLEIISRIENQLMIAAENDELISKLETPSKSEILISNIVYGSQEMEEVLNIVSRVAVSKASVMIRGESGTGKELIARAIHSASNRSNKPFIVVNCAALPETLFESELFGHEKGSYTGAVKQRIGKFEQADGGTLFVDEVGDIPMPVQVKLLRALQFGEIERLGGDKTLKLDVRIISATNRNLEQMTENNEFREDLFYRLNVVSINLPPLRKRKSDIKKLIEYFIDKFNEINGKSIKGVAKEAMDYLLKYNYPGNIRELENIMQRAVVLARDKYITINDLPGELSLKFETESKATEQCFELGDLNQKVELLETELIKRALIESLGNQSKAGEILNISERTLRYKMLKYGLK
jgi:two-component system NtrC family response regulator